jgi:hypothetical protein
LAEVVANNEPTEIRKKIWSETLSCLLLIALQPLFGLGRFFGF